MTPSEREEFKIAVGKPATLLLLGIWFGFFAGLAEGLVQAYRIFYLDRIIWLSKDVIWMAPLANVLLFIATGLVLLVISRWTPLSISAQFVILVYSFLFFRALLSLTSRIEPLASTLLAAGVAVQASRIIVAYPNTLLIPLRLSLFWTKRFQSRRKTDATPERQTGANVELPGRRQFAVGAGAAIAGLAFGVNGWAMLNERKGLDALPQPKAPALTNVLLIVLDTVRAKSLSLYGYERATTPWLSEYAKRGVRFDHAYVTAPWTLPSHASMFTGLHPHSLFQGWWEPLSPTHLTLAEALSQQGYLTAGFIANIFFCSYLHGLDRGFLHYEDFPVSSAQVVSSSFLVRNVASGKIRALLGLHQRIGRKDASIINQDFLRWLARRDPQRPFFAFLNYYDAHDPYLPPAEFALKFWPEKPRGHFVPGETVPPKLVREMNAAYDGSIAYLDYQLSLLFEDLEQQGILDNTLVIITSDHGEHFGEHDLMNHANSLYSPLLHVPLVLSCPQQIPEGVIVQEAVSLRDLPSTVTDSLGLGEEIVFPGNSLARFWAGPVDNSELEPEAILSEVRQNALIDPVFLEKSPLKTGDLKSIIFEGMHYIRNQGDGREELYDLQNDPAEENDLAESDTSKTLLETFRASLEVMLEHA